MRQAVLITALFFSCGATASAQYQPFGPPVPFGWYEDQVTVLAPGMPRIITYTPFGQYDLLGGYSRSLPLPPGPAVKAIDLPPPRAIHNAYPPQIHVRRPAAASYNVPAAYRDPVTDPSQRLLPRLQQ